MIAKIMNRRTGLPERLLPAPIALAQVPPRPALRITPPGFKGGACTRPCGHQHCDHQREIAARPCSCCGKPIGFGVGYWFTTPTGKGVVHADCLGGRPCQS